MTIDISDRDYYGPGSAREVAHRIQNDREGFPLDELEDDLWMESSAEKIVDVIDTSVNPPGFCEYDSFLKI